ncbi:choice-of-anchor I family protein [Muricoccus aerilatus]|uniref:choice-of-anchor I family protein n=1 Tax=Muricoccus aerilatus TaxID=452982 RepID=UPI0006936D3A|nr:choice-of-anchor I family protein [Roseomonas aerilata]
MATISGNLLWTRDSTDTPAGSAEVIAYDPRTERVLVLGPTGVEALAAADGALRFSLPRADLGSLGTGNSVAVHGDVIAVAYDGPTPGSNGSVAFYRMAADGNAAAAIRQVEVGAVPDMVTFTPDGSRLLVAIEGEPNANYGVNPSGDPVGGVAVIDVATGASTFLGFEGFDTEALRASGVRITGVPGITAVTDLEPEYIAVSADGTKAYVTLQENNAVALLDLGTLTYTNIFALGTKDYSLPGQGLDPSDRDGGANIVNANLRGLYMPDGIATFESGGRTYLVTANEGDASEWGSYSDVARVSTLSLDEASFGGAADVAAVKAAGALGRLQVSKVDGDTDGDGDIDVLHALGGRSFSIWEVTHGGLVQTYDSGDMIERMLLQNRPDLFDDTRSDDKGPEPESVTLGIVNGQLYAFVALERADSVMSFAINSPTDVTYAGIVATDDAPEVIHFVSAEDAPAGAGGPLLLSPAEGSGVTTAHALTETGGNFTLQILHGSDFEAGLAATTRASRFAAIVDKLEDSVANSITLSSGDNYIPSPFNAAGTDPSVKNELQDLYSWLLGVPASDFAGLALNPATVDIAIMNALGVQASVFGNHEFDFGPAAVAAAIDFTKGTGTTAASVTSIGAMFPYLSANLDFAGEASLRSLVTATLRDAASYATTAADLDSGTALTAEAADQQISPWTTIVENGQTIGVLGLTTQLLASISSVGGVRVLDPQGDGGVDNTTELVAILQPYVDQMTAQGINKVVLLSHLQQYQLELDLATKLSGVDVIVAGGSHAVFADGSDVLQPGDAAAQSYPVFVTGADGKSTAVVNTGNEYAYVGRLVVTFDANGNIIPSSVDPAVSGAYATTDTTVAALWGSEDAYADGTRGGEVRALTDAVTAVINQKDGNLLGYTDVYLEGRRGEVRTEETNLGDLTADANLFVAKQVDAGVTVSIKNGGGIRAEIGSIGLGAEAGELPPQANPLAGKPEGAVSQLDIENSLRFNNALSIVSVTAAEMVRIFEHAVSGVAPGATPGSFGQVGGVSFSYDPTATSQILNVDGTVQRAGARVQNLVIVNDDGAVIDTVVQNGALVGDPSRAIKMATLSFLADGGDGYPIGLYADSRVDLLNNAALAEGAATFAAKGSEQDALAEYLKVAHSTADAAFTVADTAPAGDERIQNLAFRTDTVLPVLHAGGATDDTVVGQDGRDILVGLDGNDVLVGLGGADFLLGVAGNDLAFGGDGSDTIYGEAGNDHLRGDAGNDVLVGDTGVDILVGGEGNDLAFGGADADAFYGEAGNDHLRGDDGNDLLIGDTGLDTLVGGSDGDLAFGGADADELWGEAGRDILLGEAGNDLAFGGDDADTLYGADGSDHLRGDGGNDVLVGDAGLDTLAGGDGNDLAFGGADGDALYGELGDDHLRGDAGTDTIFGGLGNDILVGGDGDDFILGAEGDDALYGEGGRDVYIFEAASGRDLIYGFGQVGADDDLLQFQPGTFVTFQQVMAASRQESNNVVISLSGTDTVTLTGISLSSLSESDFIFG